MAWTDQKPQVTDSLLQGRATSKRGKDFWFEIDLLPVGDFRITIGSLFGSSEVCRKASLEDAIRHFNKMLSFN